MSSASSRLPASSWESPAKFPGGFSMLGFCFFTGASCPLALGPDREKEDKEACGFLSAPSQSVVAAKSSLGFFQSQKTAQKLLQAGQSQVLLPDFPGIYGKQGCIPGQRVSWQPGGCRLGLRPSLGTTGVLQAPTTDQSCDTLLMPW